MTNPRGTPVISRRLCPICQCQIARYLLTIHFALPDKSPLPSHYDLLVCQQCGSGFADSDANVGAYEDYYRAFSKYEDAAVATGGGDEPADQRRIEELAVFLTAQVPTDARVLDVGCGNGGLMAALRQRGLTDLTGFDPAPACTARILSQGLAACRVSLPLNDPTAINGHGGPFDLIVLSHVLEHLFDAHAVVASLLPLLATGGLLYLEVPDASRYCTDGFPPLYFFDPEHINHFSAESLTFLGASLGLVPRITGHKFLTLANGSRYPAVFGLFQPGVPPRVPPVTEGGLYPLLQAYVGQSLADLEPLRTRILALVGADRPFALWGAGSLSQRLVSEPWFPWQSLRAVVDRDRNKQGLRFAGHIIASPEMGLRGLPDSTVILCAAAIATEAIENDYRALQLPHPFHAIAG